MTATMDLYGNALSTAMEDVRVWRRICETAWRRAGSRGGLDESLHEFFLQIKRRLQLRRCGCSELLRECIQHLPQTISIDGSSFLFQVSLEAWISGTSAQTSTRQIWTLSTLLPNMSLGSCERTALSTIICMIVLSLRIPRFSRNYQAICF